MNYANYYRPNTRPRSKPSRPTYQNPTDNPLFPNLNYGGPPSMRGQQMSYQAYTPQQTGYQGYQSPGMTWSPEAGQYVQSDPSGKPIRIKKGGSAASSGGPYNPGFLGGGGGYGQQRPNPGYSIYQPQTPVGGSGGSGWHGFPGANGGGFYQGYRPGTPQNYGPQSGVYRTNY